MQIVYQLTPVLNPDKINRQGCYVILNTVYVVSMRRKINKQDRVQSLYILAVSAVKTKGVLASQQEIYNLVDAIVIKKTSIEPLHTSRDIQSQTYLKIIDWLRYGKRGKPMTVEQILLPSHIRKTASSFGFSGAKYAAPVCRLEDWSPVEHITTDESTRKGSSLLDIWLSYSYKLDPVAESVIRNVSYNG